MILRALFTVGCSVAILFSLAGQELLLDSTYYDVGLVQTQDFERDERSYYRSYDDENRPLLIETQRYFGADTWVNWRRREYTYTEEGDLSALLTLQWSPMNEDWFSIKERTYEYDEEGNMTARQVRTATEPGSSLVNNRRWQYSYEGIGLQTEVLFQRWEDSDWNNVSRQQWSYNAASLPTEQLRQRWSGTAWEDARRRMWMYNDEVLISVTEQSYDAETDIWTNERRRGYLSGGQELWALEVEQTWNTGTAAWVNVSRELLDYNANQQLESTTLQAWEEDAWLNEYQTSRTSNNEMVNILSNRWDAKNDVWVSYARYQLAFNMAGRRILEQGWQFWESTMEVWLNEERTNRRRYFWSEGVVSTQEPSPDAGCLFPNPYRQGQEVQCSELSLIGNVTVELINSIGQVVHQQKIDGASSFRIDASAPGGWYICRLRQNNQVLHLQPLVLIP